MDVQAKGSRFVMHDSLNSAIGCELLLVSLFIVLSIIGWRQRCCLVLARAVLKNVYAICISLTSNFTYIYGQYCHSFCHSYNLHSSLESSKNQENNISSYWAAYVLPSTMKPSGLHAIHLMFATSPAWYLII